MSTNWVVTDAGSWRSLPPTRQHEIRVWLTLNGIRPGDVPAEATVVLTETDGGVWEIWFEEFVRNDDGAIVVDPDKPDEAFIRELAVPLQVDPPMHWLTEAL